MEPNVYTSLDKVSISTEELAPPAPPLDLNGLATTLKENNQKEKEIKKRDEKRKRFTL